MRVLRAAYGVRYSCSLPQSFYGQINPLKQIGLFYLPLSSTVKTNSTSCPYSVFMCFRWISEQRATTALNSADWFLGAFAKLRKLFASLHLSVRPPARMQQLGSHWTDFHEI
jgi:hypothetical protein